MVDMRIDAFSRGAGPDVPGTGGQLGRGPRVSSAAIRLPTPIRPRLKRSRGRGFGRWPSAARTEGLATGPATSGPALRETRHAHVHHCPPRHRLELRGGQRRRTNDATSLYWRLAVTRRSRGGRRFVGNVAATGGSTGSSPARHRALKFYLVQQICAGTGGPCI